MKDFIGTGLALLGVSLSDINGWTLPLVGVPLTVVGMAGLGAYLSFGYGSPEKNRKRLYKLAFTNALLAVFCVAILPAWLGWEWATPRIEAPLAGAMAFAARFVIDPLIDIVPELIRKVFKLREYSKVEQEKNDGQSS